MESFQRAQQALLRQQGDDGRFEGKLTSNTYPSLSYALLDLVRSRVPEPTLVDWILRQQTPRGYWRLDASERTDPEVTSFAHLVLGQLSQRFTKGEIDAPWIRLRQEAIRQALARTPNVSAHLWIVRLFEAICGRRDWGELIPPRRAKFAMGMAQRLMPLLPRVLLRHVKPPMHLAPPSDLFQSPAFERLFIAEQHTLVPLLFLIESRTLGRRDLLHALLEWLLEHRLSDGSWFRVHFITAISVLALLEARRLGLTKAPVEISLDWLESTRNLDGGYREAINLNVWDTALSTIALLESGISPDHLSGAGKWLVAHQNADGGWAFSGLPTGGLPSDADDTALATLALLKLGYSRDHPSVASALRWLLGHQGRDGSWSTYVPGAGDVGCVSVTAHAVETCLAVGGLEDSIQRALRWIQKHQRFDGSWQDLWLAQYTYGTACAIIALVKAGRRRSRAVEDGVRWLEGAQHDDGGWGEDMQGVPAPSTAEQTGWASHALSLVDPGALAPQRGIEWLIRNQKEDGGWDPACVGIYWEVIGGYADPIYAQVFPLLGLAHGKEAPHP